MSCKYDKNHLEWMEKLEKSISNEWLSDSDASLIIENVLDSLYEVGNGETEEGLEVALHELFAFRDYWFKRVIKERLNK